MTDTQVSGNKSSFSLLLSEMIGETNYYFKSGYFSYSKQDLAVAKECYNLIYLEILKIKSSPDNKVDLRLLYKYFCRVKNELESHIFINTPNQNKDFLENVKIEDNMHLTNIYNLSFECLKLLKKSSDDFVDLRTYSPDFNTRDVLIGPLRNREQLDICLERNFYHIPCENLSADPKDINYIALYQSKNFFGQNAGIRYWARVNSYEITERTKITEIPKNSDEKYCKFIVSEWNTLPDTIKMSGFGAPFTTTSMYLLLLAKDVCELSFRDKTLHKLYRTILKSVNENRTRVATHYRNIIISAEDGKVNAYKNKRRVYSVSFENYLKSPGKFFWKIISFIKD